MVPGTGPGVLLSGDPWRLLAGTQRPVSCLGSGGILYLSIFSPTLISLCYPSEQFIFLAFICFYLVCLCLPRFIFTTGDGVK